MFEVSRSPQLSFLSLTHLNPIMVRLCISLDFINNLQILVQRLNLESGFLDFRDTELPSTCRILCVLLFNDNGLCPGRVLRMIWVIRGGLNVSPLSPRILYLMAANLSSSLRFSSASNTDLSTHTPTGSSLPSAQSQIPSSTLFEEMVEGINPELRQ